MVQKSTVLVVAKPTCCETGEGEVRSAARRRVSSPQCLDRSDCNATAKRTKRPNAAEETNEVELQVRPKGRPVIPRRGSQKKKEPEPEQGAEGARVEERGLKHESRPRTAFQASVDHFVACSIAVVTSPGSG